MKKRITAAVLTAILALCMGVTAFAAETSGPFFLSYEGPSYHFSPQPIEYVVDEMFDNLLVSATVGLGTVLTVTFDENRMRDYVEQGNPTLHLGFQYVLMTEFSPADFSEQNQLTINFDKPGKFYFSETFETETIWNNISFDIIVTDTPIATQDTTPQPTPTPQPTQPQPPIATPDTDGISVTLNSAPIAFEGQGPEIVDGRTLVPVRGVFEAMGFVVGWDGDTRQATLTRGGDTVVITIDSATFTTNGATHTLDVPAQIIGGRTLVPLRAVLESVGYSLDWDGDTRTVLITS